MTGTGAPVGPGIFPMLHAFFGRALVFNGRGGLELPDCLRGGAAGLIPGPETIDLTAAIHAAWAAGRHDTAERLYAEVLPALAFMMQGVGQFLTYGKALLAARLGVEVGPSRAPALAATPFGLACVARHAARFGPLALAPRPDSNPVRATP